MPRLFCTLAATVLLSAPAPAQTLIEGGRIEPPVLGRFFDPQAKSIRTLNGVPGSTSASAPGDALFRYGAAAPHRAWSIVDRAAAGTLELLTFGRSGAALRALDAANGVEQIAFSPSGDAAILYWRGSRVELWKSFSTVPERAGVYPLEGLSGEAAALAVADDASVGALILRTETGATAYSLADGIQAVGDSGDWSAVAFAPNSRTAYLANRETNEIMRFSTFGAGGAPVVVAADADGVSSPSALALSGDGRKLVVANQEDPSVAVIDLETRRSSVLTLERAADGLFALEGNAVYRLSASPKPEIFLLDADGVDARITVAAVESALASEAPAAAAVARTVQKGGK